MLTHILITEVIIKDHAERGLTYPRHDSFPLYFYFDVNEVVIKEHVDQGQFVLTLLIRSEFNFPINEFLSIIHF